MALIILLFVTFFLTLSPTPAQATPPGLLLRGPLEKHTFIHYRRQNAKPPSVGNNKPTACYGFLARGAKWKTLENYYINPTHSNVSDTLVTDAVIAGATEWETKTGVEIFAAAITDSSAVYQPDIYDNKNVVAFGPYSDPNVIAVTTVWGYFSGPTQTRELVEWDMLFNTHYTWGNAETSKMDLQNIATHELGHSAGLADLYTASCLDETMYGYSTEGEISKRDLNPGDILGIQTLYN